MSWALRPSQKALGRETVAGKSLPPLLHTCEGSPIPSLAEGWELPVGYGMSVLHCGCWVQAGLPQHLLTAEHRCHLGNPGVRLGRAETHFVELGKKEKPTLKAVL